jgi:hypothetical protein
MESALNVSPSKQNEVALAIFSPRAKEFSERIPENIRKTLLANVRHGRCAASTTIVNVRGTRERGDLILRGQELTFRYTEAQRGPCLCASVVKASVENSEGPASLSSIAR